ncbi:MAG: DUF4054 domain-containing protein [Candidatus Accumulibacter sp.]|jgi:hypothetical protein|nr:DUF4054 domain-containing protein [Accumulibacter sp.]
MTLTPGIFRARFPEFSNPETYPEAVIRVCLDDSLCWLHLPSSEGCDAAYYLLAAHFLFERDALAKGESQYGAVSNASVGGVSVGLSVPTTKSAWAAWLSGSPYGQKLLAWLSVKAAGGASLGGLPERDAFRKVGGVFL